MKKKIIFVILFFILTTPLTVWVIYLADRQYRLSVFENTGSVLKLEKGALQYRIKGQMNGEGKPQVLFIHGTPGGFDNGAELDDVPVLMISRPGYLGSDLKVGKTPELQAKAYAELLSQLDVDSIVLVASSGGGPSALAFASLFPEKTKALVLISAISQGAPEKRAKVMPFFESDFMSWLFIYTMQGLSVEKVLKPIMPIEENRRLIKENPEKVKQMYKALWAFWPVSLRKAGQENDWKQFGKINPEEAGYQYITAPTLIIHGDQDLNVPVRHSVELAQQIPDSRLQIIEGGDHFMMISHSEQIKAMIKAFLGELDNKNNLEPDAATH